MPWIEYRQITASDCSGILNTWIGNGSVIYVYRKNIRVAPTWILNWMAAVDSDEYDMDADPSGRVSGV